jgi:hypothetical protein
MTLIKVIGYTIILIGVLINEFSIKFISDSETRFASTDKSLILILLQLLVILIGLYIIRKGKVALQNLLLAFLSMLISFILLEIILVLFTKFSIEDDHPVYVPLEYKVLDWAINRKHKDRSDANIYGFNDTNHRYKKPDDVDYRIAVLGDSFIWGDGVEDSVIWINRLQKNYLLDNCKIEVLNWGKRGWSTLDQNNFLKSDGFVGRNIQKSIGIIFPNSISFITDLLNKFFDTYFDYGYVNWLQKLYSPAKLQQYNTLLMNIKSFCLGNGINFCFVLTPENYSSNLNEYFVKIVPLLENLNITFLNLLPQITDRLKGYPLRRLWANPANGHPGYLVSDAIANFMYKFLNERRYFHKCQ